MAEFEIANFGGGLNESVNPTLIQVNEAQDLMNVDIKNGSLKATRKPLEVVGVPSCPIVIEILMVYFKGTEKRFVASGEGKLYMLSNGSWNLLGSGFQSNNWDFINYKYNNEDVMILVNGKDNNKILKDSTLRDMKDRRISYDEEAVINGYYDANGVLKTTEDQVTTLAPKAKFIELHFERVWLGDDKSVYFSKDFDPEDYTVPVSELDANQHGGEIVMESFDATNIIGMKVVFNDVVIFKEKSLFKIVGAYVEQYEKIQLFSFNGAIADKSIVVTSKGAYFLNVDGIYQYDGVNCTIISNKIDRTINSLDKETLSNAVATDFENKYILTARKDFTYNGEEFRYLTIEYDYDNGLFTKHTYGMKSFLNVIHKLYGVSEQGTTIHEYGKGDFLPFHWNSGISTLGIPNAIKECEDIYLMGSGDSMEVTFRTEKKPKSKLMILKTNPNIYHKPLINFGRMFSIEFKHTNNKEVEIHSFKAVMDVDVD